MKTVSTHRPAQKAHIQTQFDRLHFHFLSGAAKSSVYHDTYRR
ncbi:MAG: hypothetical protein WAU86_03710 [Oricola sp.]